MIECSACHEPKPETDFYSVNGKRHGLQCRACQLKKGKARLARMTRDERRDKRLAIDIKKYGLSLDDYYRLLEHQGGLCAICLRPPNRASRTTRLHVDHDHRTGAVRGLLCSRCNGVLGYFHEDVRMFAGAANYLVTPPAVTVFSSPRRHVNAPPVMEEQQ